MADSKSAIVARFKRLGGGDARKGARMDMTEDRKIARGLSARKGFGGRK